MNTKKNVFIVHVKMIDPGGWPRQPCRLEFFPCSPGQGYPASVSSMLKWKLGILNGSDIFFIRALIAGSQGLAWALIDLFQRLFDYNGLNYRQRAIIYIEKSVFKLSSTCFKK